MVSSLLSNGWVEDVGTWLLGLAMGALFARRSIVKPAREHNRWVAQHLAEQHRAAGMKPAPHPHFKEIDR